MHNKRKKILLVEDDLDLCNGWKELFELFEYDVECFQKGIDVFTDKKVLLSCDLLITDYYLPDLNGIEVIKKVRGIHPQIPALLLTGSREKSIVESIRGIHHCAVMYKPLGIDDLELRIKEMMAA